MVSHDLVRKLNLMVNIKNTTNVTVANNLSVKTIGTCTLPIEIQNKVFPCQAIVLKNAAQDILIGMNWISKYEVNLNLKRNLMTIIEDDFIIQHPIITVKNEEIYVKILKR